MNDATNYELLSAYLDGELTADERARVETLLAADPAARQLLDELRAVGQAIQGLPPYTLGEDLSQRILQTAERRMLTATDDRPTPAKEPPLPSVWSQLTWRGLFNTRALVWSGIAVAVALMLTINEHFEQKRADRDIAMAPKDAEPAHHAAADKVPGEMKFAETRPIPSMHAPGSGPRVASKEASGERFKEEKAEAAKSLAPREMAAGEESRIADDGRLDANENGGGMGGMGGGMGMARSQPTPIAAPKARMPDDRLTGISEAPKMALHDRGGSAKKPSDALRSKAADLLGSGVAKDEKADMPNKAAPAGDKAAPAGDKAAMPAATPPALSFAPAAPAVVAASPTPVSPKSESAPALTVVQPRMGLSGSYSDALGALGFAEGGRKAGLEKGVQGVVDGDTIVRCDITVQAAESRTFEQLLAKGGIDAKDRRSQNEAMAGGQVRSRSTSDQYGHAEKQTATPPSKASGKADAKELVYYVEMTPAQMDELVAQLNKRSDAFSAVAVESAADRRNRSLRSVAPIGKSVGAASSTNGTGMKAKGSPLAETDAKPQNQPKADEQAGQGSVMDAPETASQQPTSQAASGPLQRLGLPNKDLNEQKSSSRRVVFMLRVIDAPARSAAAASMDADAAGKASQKPVTSEPSPAKQKQ